MRNATMTGLCTTEKKNLHENRSYQNFQNEICLSVSFTHTYLLQNTYSYILSNLLQRKEKKRSHWNLLFDFQHDYSGCGYFQPKFKKKGLDLTAEWTRTNDENQEKKIAVTADQALAVLRNISDEDCIVLGMNPKFCRPEWLIVTVLPVPPLSVRPSVVMFGSARSQVGTILERDEIECLQKMGGAR